MAAEVPTLDEIRQAVREIIREELGVQGRPTGDSLTTEQAATAAGVTQKTVLAWINEGVNGRLLPAGRRGKRRVVSRVDLERFLAGERPVPAKADELLRRIG